LLPDRLPQPRALAAAFFELLQLTHPVREHLIRIAVPRVRRFDPLSQLGHLPMERFQFPPLIVQPGLSSGPLREQALNLTDKPALLERLRHFQGFSQSGLPESVGPFPAGPAEQALLMLDTLPHPAQTPPQAVPLFGLRLVLMELRQ